MKTLLLKFLVLNFIIGCNSSNDKSEQKTDNDTTAIVKSLINQTVIDIFNKEEKNALDSVAKYKLESVQNSCLKYLYIIYGDELIDDSSAKRGQTIGECNIRLIGFKKKLNSIRELSYGVFINDSIPTRAILNTSMGRMINGFDVDINTKMLQSANVGEFGKMEIINILALCDSASKSTIFRDYINHNRKKLHPKFIKILEQNDFKSL